MKIRMATSDLFNPLVAFFIWTLTSFLCHKLAKLALTLFNEHVTSWPSFVAPVIVTALQVTSCYATVNFSSRRGKLFCVVAISHTVATLATNTSLALVFASSTMAIKLLEPMTSAVMQSLVLKVPMRTESVVSMLVIVAGAVMFVGDPTKDSLVLKGLLMAFLSNLILGLRNVAIKLDHCSNKETGFRSLWQIASYVLATALLISAAYVFEIVVKIIPTGSTYFLLLCLASSFCHVTYSYVSTNIILRYMSVVSHAIANIVKRVMVVLLLHVTGRRLASAWNWAGLALCTCGLFLYNGRKISNSLSTEARTVPSAKTNPGTNLENQGRPLDPFQDAARKTSLLCRLLFVCVTLYLFVFAPSHWFGFKPGSDYAHDLRHGLVEWRDGQPLINSKVTFQPLQKNAEKVEMFIKQKIMDVSHNTDQLSPYLTATREMLNETARLHLSLLSDLIGGKKYALLIGVASFENKGDPAITIGQLKILEKLGVELVFYINEENCTDEYYAKAVSVVSTYSSEELVILMQGGGNIIGYAGVNFCREKAFTYFPGYQVVLLSQSVYMRGSQDLVERMVRIYCCKPNLTIFLRDRLSLAIAKRLFTNGTRLILAPDMAFGIGPVQRFSPPFYDILWLKRIDDEHPRYFSLPPFPPDVTVHVADWWHSGWDTPPGTTTVETAYNVMQNGFLFLQRGRVVVTERLHGHILSTLLDQPHVILDNKDKKLSSYHNTWTRALANVRLASNPQQALHMALELLNTYGPSLPSVFRGMNIKEHE